MHLCQFEHPHWTSMLTVPVCMARSITSLNDRANGTILGFVYDAYEAPQPQPVIKGSASRSGCALATIVGAAAAAALLLLE